MRAVDIIEKKRDGIELSSEEIKFFLDSYLAKEVPDYQMASFLMAVYFKGMTKDELKVFTEKMMHSGELISFEGVDKFFVDKHSTGGVGDKTTIALGPILSALGMATAKLSGKGLGHTGGTIDKFESIEGFEFPKDKDGMVDLLKKTSMGIMGYSDKIVPLDKALYSLRDVTGTVPSIPLIASSIMSKKLAVKADAIILDVKVGSGAFMKKYEQAEELAQTMVSIGELFDRNIVAVLTDMDQPLGEAVGNSLEVIEAVETLKGRGPEDFKKLVYTLASIALLQKGEIEKIEDGFVKIDEVIKDGSALKILESFVINCNGSAEFINDYSKLPIAKTIYELKSDKSGYIESMEAEMIGKAAMILGAGRATKEDEVDHSVGLVLKKKVGDRVEVGEVLVEFYYNGEKLLETAKKEYTKALKISDSKVEKKDIIIKITGGKE